MKKIILLLALALPAFGQQGVRFDSQAIGPKGTISNVIVSLCASTATGVPCSPQVQSFTDATLTTQCPSGFPVTPTGTTSCQSTSDFLGNYGFWVAPGNYQYCLSGSSIATPQCWQITPSLVAGGTITANAGTAAVPGFNFATDTNTGIFDLSPDNLAIATNGVGRAQFNSSGEFIPSGECFDWNSGALGSTQDTGICRDSAGAIDFGNGSPGDKSAILNAAGINLSQFFSTAGFESTKVIRDCRKDGLVGNGVTDDSAALNACLANAFAANENVQLPCSNILVNTSINDTNKPSLVIYGCGSSNPGITAGTGEGNTNVTTILCNTGNHPCVDGLGSAHSGLWHVNLLSRNSFSTPSNIARMIGRDSALDPNGGHAFCFSEFMYDFDVYVLMESSPTANNNLGRIGYYDVGGAEIFRIASSDLTADRPAYLSTTNATVGASSLYQTIIGTCATSMEGWESNMVAYTPVSATGGGAITLEGPTNGLHNLFSGDCIMNAGAASGDYCLQIGADGSYGIKMFPAFTVEQIQGGGGVAFFNGTCTGCTFDASTSSPSGMTNAWYQFSGGITTRGNSTAGIGAVDSVFAAHRVNPGDTPAPLLKCSGCGSPLVTLKGGTFTLGSTTVPFSDTNTIISGSTVIASGFTDSQVTFGVASKYILLDDSGTSIIGGVNGTLAYKRIGATNGTTVVAGDFALSAGWGTTASKAFQGGSDGDGFLGVTSSGTGQAANPTITFTFHDGSWGANAPNCTIMRADFNTAPTNVIFGESASSATQITWGFNGTPVAGNTYSLKWKCGSRN